MVLYALNVGVSVIMSYLLAMGECPPPIKLP